MTLLTGFAMCGIELDGNRLLEGYVLTGVCTNKTNPQWGLKPSHVTANGKAWFGCGPAGATTGSLPVEMTMDLSIRVNPLYGANALSDPSYVRGYILAQNHKSENKAELDVYMPDNTHRRVVIDTDGWVAYGSQWRIAKDTWYETTAIPTTVLLQYPDHVTLRKGQTAEILTSSWPVYVTAATDLSDVSVITDAGIDLIRHGTAGVTKKLTLTHTWANHGVRSGHVTLNVTAK